MPQLMAQIVREGHCKPRFDALAVDEAQDHDTWIPGFPADWAGPGWWGVYWALLKHGEKARTAAFGDPAQRPAFRGGGGFDASALLRRSDFRPVQMRLMTTARYSRPVFQYLKGLQSDALAQLNADLLQRGSLPDGPEVVVCDARTAEVAATADRIVSAWFDHGWCRPEQVMVLSRHRQMRRSALDTSTSLAGKRAGQPSGTPVGRDWAALRQPRKGPRCPGCDPG